MMRPRFWCLKLRVASSRRAQRFAHEASSRFVCSGRRCRLRRSTFIFASNALAIARDERMCGARATWTIGANCGALDPLMTRALGGAQKTVASMTLATTRAVQVVRAGLRMRRLFDSHSGGHPVTPGLRLANRRS